MQTQAVSRQRQAISDFLNPEPNTFYVFNEKCILGSTGNGKCFFFERGKENPSLILTSVAYVSAFDDALPETAKAYEPSAQIELSVEQVMRLGVSQEILIFILEHIGLKAAA